MAISKISQYNSSPTDETDYQAQNEHLQAFINQLNSGAFILSQASASSIPYLPQGVYMQMGGTVYIVDTEDYTIQGTITSGSTNYIYLTESGDNLIATWTTDISSYSWNSVYNCMSDGTNILLPYSVYCDGTNYALANVTFNNLNIKGNNVYPIRYDTYTIDRETVNMDAIAVGETVYATASLTQDSSNSAELESPTATGEYFITVEGAGDTDFQFTKISENSRIIDNGAGSSWTTITTNLIVTRVS